MPKRVTTADFVNRVRSIHGDRYDYSSTIYVNARVAVSILCKQHGVFYQSPDTHAHGAGCPKCGVERSIAGSLKNTVWFLNKCRLVHGDRYDYSRVVYRGIFKSVVVGCRIHGWFEQVANGHCNGAGCSKCKSDRLADLYRKDRDVFIEQAVAMHGDSYDYTRVEYVKHTEKVSIVCRHHGEFWQAPNHHLAGKGCPICNESHGEREVRRVLSSMHRHRLLQQYHAQAKCYGLRYRRDLRFDFVVEFLGGKLGFIEYSGEQHYYPARWCCSEQAMSKLLEIQHRDTIKLNYCCRYNIPLLIIPYQDFNRIDDIIRSWVARNGKHIVRRRIRSVTL